MNRQKNKKLSPREVIEDIRRNEYGIGLPPGSPQRVGFDKLRPRLDAAVQHLSDDLYTENVHFVLELVQNADDNQYLTGEAPYLRLVRSVDCLLVQNNEVGFEELNVRALCDIGQSSKKKALGYIGEKGIGFKSVFRITDKPHIFSNGYSFRFCRHDPETGLGFIVPEWVDEVPGFVKKTVTNFVLPLRTELTDAMFEREWFGPTLLLFLKKLKTIEYIDKTKGTGWCYRRIDNGTTVELRSGQGVQRWRLARSITNVPSTLREEKRNGVIQSEIVLAFPLDSNGYADASLERDVHAYLPVRRYGFHFVVQADFILSSSRETILEDRPWNLWLRDQIAPAFIKAVETFRQEKGALRTTFLHYVSEEQRLNGLFAPVSDHIRASLRATDCILTASGRWAKPEEVIVGSEELQAVILSDDVMQIFGREYMAPEFKAPISLLKTLGTLVFEMRELLCCLKDEEWLRSKPDDWFSRLFAYLSTRILKQDLGKLEVLRIVPMEDGTLASVAERKGRIFHSPTKETNFGFEEKMPLVRKTIFEGVDEETRSSALRFLEDLGVKESAPADLIAKYILPLFESQEQGDSWKEMQDGFCIGSVEFIKNHLDEYLKAGNDLARLTKSLFIKFVHPENRWYSKPDNLYLGESFGSQAGLEKLLDRLGEPRFVDPVYLERGLERLARRWKKSVASDSVQRRKAKEADYWRAFFRKIGVHETLRVVREPTETEPGQASCPELEKLFATKDRPRIEQVVRLLDENWSYYRPCLLTDMKRRERGLLLNTGRSKTKFGQMLADTCWLIDKSGTLRRPSELFLDTPRTREILGDDVPYLGVEFRDRRIIEDLGICKGPTVVAALERLGGLAARQDANVSVARTIYKFLDQQFESNSQEIAAAFSADPLCLIYGPPARFLSSGRVFWHDPGFAFLSRRSFLSKQWPELKEFFVRKLGVAVSPSPEDYAVLLRELSEEEDLSPQLERAVWSIYRELDRCLAASADPDEITVKPWWKELVQNGVFLTEVDGFWSNDGDIFVNDHDEFYRVFKEHKAIAFLKVPPNQHPLIAQFLKAARIKLLSDAVSIGHIDPSQLHEEPKLTARCRSVVPYILRYMFFRENETYREKEEAGGLAKLNGMSVLICDDLEVEVALNDVSTRVRRRFSSRLPQLFVAREAAKDLDGLATEFARMLGGSESLEMFVTALLAKEGTEGMERFMQAKNIPELPSIKEDTQATLDVTAEIESRGTQFDEVAEDNAGRFSDDDQNVPASMASDDLESNDESPPDEEPVPHDHVLPRAASSVLNRIPARAAEGRTPRIHDETESEQSNLGSAGSSRQRADFSATRQPNRPTPSGNVCDPPQAAEPNPTGGRWIPSVPPSQAKVNVRDYNPRPTQDKNRTFGEKPSTVGGDRSKIEQSGEPMSSPHPQRYDIGHWGEEYAFAALEEEVSSRHPGAKVIRVGGTRQFVTNGVVVAEVRWLNWQEDRGVGYDILVEEGDRAGYVEVKSTAGEARTWFDVTATEWDCARVNGPRYRIFRVFNAGRQEPRIEVIRDPYKLWQEGQLVVRLVRIEL